MAMKTNRIVDVFVKFLAELLGTLALVCLGCMGLIPKFENPPLLVAFGFGFVVMAIIQILVAISGCHINPCLTVCALVHRHISIPMAFVYVAAQLIGGTLGFGLLISLVPRDYMYPDEGICPGVCSTVPNPELSTVQAFFIEFVGTSILIWAVCSMWDPRNAKNHDSVSIKFGLTVAVLGMTAGPFTGPGMNPARSLGPAVWNGDWDQHWIYWIAPLSASLIISLIYKFVFWRPAPLDEANTEKIVPVIDIDSNENLS